MLAVVKKNRAWDLQGFILDVNMLACIFWALIFIRGGAVVRCDENVPTVNVNPIENIPGIGNIIKKGDSGDFVNSWKFWLVIAITICFFIVLGYFVWRGFHRYAMLKREAEKRQSLVTVEDGTTENCEGAVESKSAPSCQCKAVSEIAGTHHSSNSNNKKCIKECPKFQFIVDTGELARRTGRSVATIEKKIKTRQQQ